MDVPRLVVLRRCLLGAAVTLILTATIMSPLSPGTYTGGALVLLAMAMLVRLINRSSESVAFGQSRKAARARRLAARRERVQHAQQVKEQNRQEELRRQAEDRRLLAEQEARAAAQRQAAYERRMALRPAPRFIRTPRDAELVAAEWMRYLGFHDAKVTGHGADGGIDVTSAMAFAQVKLEGKPTGRPALQRLHGAAQPKGRRAMFFSSMGYTSQAIEYARDVDMALFVFDRQGEPGPENGAARELVEAADRRAEAYVDTTEAG